MRFRVSCVYWTLLVISVVSSGLLFLIVASEGIQSPENPSVVNSNENFEEQLNITVDDTGGGNMEPANVIVSEIQVSVTVEEEKKIRNNEQEIDQVAATSAITSKSEETGRKPAGLEVLGESLTQQPNLSQGISETGQAVVLTLVDTATAELQSLAEPRISPASQARLVTNNATLTTSTTPSDVTQIPPPPTFTVPSTGTTTPMPTVQDFETESNETDALEKSVVDEVPEVVVVRADQRGGSEASVNVDEEDVVPEELPKMEEEPTTAPELDDSAARARIVGEDAAGVLMDTLVAPGLKDPHEDIPSFSEWAQKRLEEAEKKKTHPNASIQNIGGPGRSTGSMKVRSKNYASPDCGAKIVAANPEAGSASSVLATSRDEYMLNTCTSRVWFIVELCEAIQAKKIELANFELFSSSPKDFSVFVSDRLPTRDWSPVGQFTAKDERDVQSYALQPQLFGKFIKVELHSHYGSEHFCPISLFRVYGTSEFEVLETENQVQEPTADADDDEDDEEMLDINTGDAPRNLFGSARDAVLSIVKKAAEVLVKSGGTSNNITKLQEGIESTILQNSLVAACMTPRYTIVCDSCTDDMFAKVFQLVSCRDLYLESILNIGFVNKTLHESSVCPHHGIHEIHVEAQDQDVEYSIVRNIQATFLTSMFAPQYIAALCNVLATKERRVVLNTSYDVVKNISENVTLRDDTSSASSEDLEARVVPALSTCTLDINSPACPSTTSHDRNANVDFTTPTPVEVVPPSESLAAQIKPTKTLHRDDLKRESSAPLLESSKEAAEETAFPDVPTTVSPISNIPTSTLHSNIPEELSILGTASETTPQVITSTTPNESQELIDAIGDAESIETAASGDLLEQDVKIPPQDHLSLDTLLSDLKDLEGDAVTLHSNAAASAASVTLPSSTPQQKESVFLRLSNRIKALERNMSLSGQYLEELSRRYKKQVEEMQRSLERTVSAMGEESRRREEREAKRLEESALLKEQIANLSKSVQAFLYDRDSWRSRFATIAQHIVLICVEIVIVILILSFCRRSNDLEDEEDRSSKKVVRRKSVDCLGGHPTTRKTKKRRPSEIASHISGTYQELLIEDHPAAGHDAVKKDRKRKRKRESSLRYSTGNGAVTHHKGRLNSIPGGTNLPSRRASSSDAPNFLATPYDPQNSGYRRPESAPETTTGWYNDQVEEESQTVLQDETEKQSSQKSSSLLEELDTRNLTCDVAEQPPIASNNKQNEPSKVPKIKTGGILKNARLASPSFMKTALGSRRKRQSAGTSQILPQLRSDNWEWYSKNSGSRSSQERETPTPPPTPTMRNLVETVNGNGSNGHHDDSDESRSSSATPTLGKKDKKTTGLKKMVRKLF